MRTKTTVAEFKCDLCGATETREWNFQKGPHVPPLKGWACAHMTIFSGDMNIADADLCPTCTQRIVTVVDRIRADAGTAVKTVTL